MNFGGISEKRLAAFDDARILIFPIAYEGTVSYGAGTAEGARAIIEASRNMELYDEETDAEVYRLGIHTLKESSALKKPDKMMRHLHERTTELVSSGKFVCAIGGEHSISAPVIRAHAEQYENLSVLQIDAHADLRDTYDGTKHSHACIMRRVTEDMRLPAVQCGIRSLSSEEARAIDNLPTRIFFAKDIARPDANAKWQEEAVEELTENVYLTIDIDGLDPSLVPTTGTPEPGGLGWYEVTALIRRLAEKRRVVGMDLVEFAKAENSDAPAFLCAKLVYKSLAYIFRNDTPKVRS
jgi:agmatinase